MDLFYKQLTELQPELSVRTNEDMGRHTTFRTGGKAAYFVEPENSGQLCQVLELCRKEAVSFYILGNGSNLLVSDRGYDGVMISMGKPWARITIEGNVLRAGAGALLSMIAKEAWKASLSGLEFAAGIPGSLGGAVVMNAGAYGSEMKSVLISATVLTPKGEVETIPASNLQLGYRTSCILDCGYVVLEAAMELCQKDAAEVKMVMDDLAYQRKSKQPLEYPSAGSTFKRPEGHFAGKLIQDAGLGGFQVGGARVSEKHCGFVINRDHATASDIWSLCTQVQQKVWNQFGVRLELEVKLLGIFE